MKNAVLSAVLLLTSVSACQEVAPRRDCSTHGFFLHKNPCLCGKVTIASGDIGGNPSMFGLDDSFDVELRDKAGKLLESKRLSYKAERTFCFSGRRKGKYSIAFVLFEGGNPQPAAVFPTKYTSDSHKACDAVYLVPAACPK